MSGWSRFGLGIFWNYVVLSRLSRSYTRNFDGLEVEMVALPELIEKLPGQ